MNDWFDFCFPSLYFTLLEVCDDPGVCQDYARASSRVQLVICLIKSPLGKFTLLDPGDSIVPHLPPVVCGKPQAW